MINKFSNKITIVTINDFRFYYYKGDLLAFYVPVLNRFYIEEKDARKKTLIEAMEQSHMYQYSGATIVTCYSLNNMLQNIKYPINFN